MFEEAGTDYSELDNIEFSEMGVLVEDRGLRENDEGKENRTLE